MNLKNIIIPALIFLLAPSPASTQISAYSDIDSLAIVMEDSFTIVSEKVTRWWDEQKAVEFVNGGDKNADTLQNVLNKVVSRFDSSSYFVGISDADKYYWTHRDSVTFAIAFRVYNKAGGSGDKVNTIFDSARLSSTVGVSVRVENDSLRWRIQNSGQVMNFFVPDSFSTDSTWHVVFLRYRDDGGAGEDAFVYKGHNGGISPQDSIADNGTCCSGGGSSSTLRFGETNVLLPEGYFEGEFALILGYRKFLTITEINDLNTLIWNTFDFNQEGGGPGPGPTASSNTIHRRGHARTVRH